MSGTDIGNSIRATYGEIDIEEFRTRMDKEVYSLPLFDRVAALRAMKLADNPRLASMLMKTAGSKYQEIINAITKALMNPLTEEDFAIRELLNK